MKVTKNGKGEYSLEFLDEKGKRYDTIQSIQSIETFELGCFRFEDEYIDLESLPDLFSDIKIELLREINIFKKLKLIDSGHFMNLSELYKELEELKQSCPDEKFFQKIFWNSEMGDFSIVMHEGIPVLSCIYLYNTLTKLNCDDIRSALSVPELVAIYDKLIFP